MKLFALAWTVVGALLVAAAIVVFLTQALGPATMTVVATTACLGVPFLAFGVWGLYAEMKPYHYETRKPHQ